MIICLTLYQKIYYTAIIILSNFAVYYLVPFMQYKLGDTVDDKHLKKKKIKKAEYLFKPIGGGSSKTLGISHPMFYLHLYGYFIGILTSIIIIIFIVIKTPMMLIVKISIYIFLSHATVVIFIVIFIGYLIKRNKLK